MGASVPAPSPRRAPIALVAAALVAGAVAVLPIGYLVVRATEHGWAPVRATLWRERTLDLALRSLDLALIVTVACLVLGTGFAWLVTRTDLPGRRVVQVLLGLPLALPSYVASFSWIGWRPELAGRTGAAIVLTTISYPYVYLPVMAALRRCDPALEDAARTLGHGPLSTFWRVTVPQVRLAAAGGGLVVGLYVLSDFGAVATMRYEVLTSVIYSSYRGSFDRTPAAVLGCVLAVLAIAVVAVERATRRRVTTAKVGSGSLRTQPRIALGPLRRPLLLVPAAWLGVALGVPARGLQLWFSRGDSRPEGSRFVEATANTLQVGALGALAVVALAFPLAFVTVRHPGRIPRLATSAAYAGHALPGVVVGLSLVFFGIRYATPIYQELPLLVLAYVVLFLSLALGSLQNAIAQIPPVLGDVARSLGRSPFSAWRSVTVRLAAPGVGAAGTLVFLTVMKELPATLFLRPTGFDTLATQLWGHTSSFSKAAAAPYAVAIVVLAALPTAVLTASGDEARRRRPWRRSARAVDA
ncbi:MAG: iron transporter permease [Acidimicrobiales bacterium]|nr:iron transporter permease [Acidimicrobiales bacterium]